MSRPDSDDEETEDTEGPGTEEPELTPEEEAELAEELRAEERRYFNVSRMFSAGLIAVLPLLVIYEAGVLLYHSEFNAAAEWVKHPIFWLQRLLMSAVSVNGVILLNVVGMVAVVMAMWRLKQRGGLRISLFVGMFLEGALYAVALGPMVLFVLTRTLQFGGFSPNFGDLFPKIVMSCGAGLYEEVVFRLVILGGVLFLFRDVVEIKPFVAGVLALLISSAAFSAAHFLAGAETLHWGRFVYRLLAGVALGVIFLVRGFGIAAWTHALYDVYVMCFLAAPT